MTNTYSLADHILSFTYDDARNNKHTDSIGGSGQNNEGSFVNQISVRLANDTWSTESDSTGSWVHNKNLARNGTIELQIRQVSDDVTKLINIYNYYFGNNGGTFETLEIKGAGGETIVTATDCRIQKAPDRDFQATAQNLSFVWTCGRIVNRV